MLMDEANYRALNQAGVIICLSARPEVIARRVESSRTRRPKLLEGGKPLGERIAELMAQRRDAYARAEAIVDTSDLSVERAADRVLARLSIRSQAMRTFRVELGRDAHPVHVGAGIIDRVGELALATGLKRGRAALVSDSNVAGLYGGRVEASLKTAGFDALPDPDSRG